MSYGEFARAIGLMTDADKWEVWHRQQVADILNLVAAAEGQSNKNINIKKLEYDRVIVQRTGRSGKGIAKESRIVRA